MLFQSKCLPTEPSADHVCTGRHGPSCSGFTISQIHGIMCACPPSPASASMIRPPDLARPLCRRPRRVDRRAIWRREHRGALGVALRVLPGRTARRAAISTCRQLRGRARKCEGFGLKPKARTVRSHQANSVFCGHATTGPLFLLRNRTFQFTPGSTWALTLFTGAGYILKFIRFSNPGRRAKMPAAFCRGF
jgi:hypothetical protein